MRAAHRSLLASLLALWPALPVAAQATFFQVPSGDVPEQLEGSGQLQTNVGSAAAFGALAVLGLGGGFELGLTTYSLALDVRDGHVLWTHNALDPDEPLSPMLLVTSQKRFELSRLLDVSLGVQLGSSLASARHVRLAARGYALLLLQPSEQLRCSGGSYVATRTLLGDDRPVGAFLGCDAEFGLFGFELDWDIGRHALGAITLGPRVHLGQHVAISAGAQLPNPWSSAGYAGVCQLEVAYPGRQE